ncbi:MAG: anti-sigma factor [Gemmatimonadota bacterium]
MDGDRFRDLALQEILTGLTGQEREEYESELDRLGPVGDAQVARMRDAVAAVGLNAPAAEPPAALRSRLIEKVRADAMAPASADKPAKPVARGSREPSRAPAGARLPDGGTFVLRPDRPEENRFPAPNLPWFAMAATIAAVVLGATTWRLSGRLEEAQLALAEAQASQAAVDSLGALLASLDADFSTISSPDASSVVLTGTSPDEPGKARAFIDPVSGRALLFVYELPVLPPDQVYQLWAIRGSTPFDAGTFRVDSDRRARVEVAEAATLLGADVLAVTVEPAPGRPTPSGDPILVSQT